MTKYLVELSQTNNGFYEVEAKTKEEALKICEKKLKTGKYTFNGTTIEEKIRTIDDNLNPTSYWKQIYSQALNKK